LTGNSNVQIEGLVDFSFRDNPEKPIFSVIKGARHRKSRQKGGKKIKLKQAREDNTLLLPSKASGETITASELRPTDLHTYVDLCYAIHERKALPTKFIANEFYEMKAWAEPHQMKQEFE